MKNITEIPYRDYLCTTPCGGDYTTCGICEHTTDIYKLMEKYEQLERLDISGNKAAVVYDDDDDDKRYLWYCDSCRILTFIGCRFEDNGCTDSVYNCHFIAEWIDKKTNEHHIGMPQFDNNKDWFDRVNDIRIVRLVCPNKGEQGSNGYYPRSTHPQYYDECPLKKNPYWGADPA